MNALKNKWKNIPRLTILKTFGNTESKKPSSRPRHGGLQSQGYGVDSVGLGGGHDGLERVGVFSQTEDTSIFPLSAEDCTGGGGEGETVPRCIGGVPRPRRKWMTTGRKRGSGGPQERKTAGQAERD